MTGKLGGDGFARRVASVSLALALAAGLEGRAAEPTGRWPNFRGLRLDGSAVARNLPDRWGGDEVLWTARLPGPGSSTPAIWDGHIFLTAADADTGELLVMGLDATNGNRRWQHTHGQNRRQGRNDMTSPSPVTDGQRVVFLFGTGEMVAYDMDGRKLWAHDLTETFGPLSWLFAYGASPLLFHERLYLQMMRRPTHRDAPADTPLESFLVAFDPATGKELWRQARPAEAVDESWESYTTPTVHRRGTAAEIILAGADTLTAHDPETGRELWRRDFNERRRGNWRLVPTPVSDGRHVFAALPRGASFAAVDPDKEAKQVAKSSLWQLTANVPDVCSPLLYEGKLYILDGDRRVVTCLDPDSGRQIWRGELGEKTVIRSSPTAADGKIYFVDENGVVFVLAAGDKFELLSRMEMGGGQPARASVAIAGDRLYVRTADALHCIGQVGKDD